MVHRQGNLQDPVRHCSQRTGPVGGAADEEPDKVPCQDKLKHVVGVARLLGTHRNKFESTVIVLDSSWVVQFSVVGMSWRSHEDFRSLLC